MITLVLSKERFTMSMTLLRSILVALVMTQVTSLAQVHAERATVSYEGDLRDAIGQPINEILPMTFRLYASAESEDPLWSELHGAVEVRDGVFTVRLGAPPYRCYRSRRPSSPALFDSRAYLG